MALAVLLLPTALAAQSQWMAQTEESYIAAQWTKPSFSGEEDYSLGSANYSLLARYALMDELRLTAGMTFVSYGYCSADKSEWISGTAVANPYLGAEIGTEDRNWFAEVGLNIPAVDNTALDGNARPAALAAAALADPERYAAFADRVVPVRVTLNANPWITRGVLRFRARLGAWQFIPHETDTEANTMLHWGAGVMFTAMNFSFGAGYSGQYLSEPGDRLLPDRALHQWGFIFGMQYGGHMVGLSIRLPLNDALTQSMNYAFSLNASYPL